jgi:hypothetical protein
MLKKIIIILILFWIIWTNYSNAIDLSDYTVSDVKQNNYKDRISNWDKIDYDASRVKWWYTKWEYSNEDVDWYINDWFDWPITKSILFANGNSNENSDLDSNSNSNTTEEAVKCTAFSTDKINCPQFKISVSNFSPWGEDILDEAKAWNWDTAKTANILLGVIIKNLIVVIWVFSLLIMTIGWGMMIFHAWQESILTKWKSMFMWWLWALVVWLCAGLIVQWVSYILF